MVHLRHPQALPAIFYNFSNPFTSLPSPPALYRQSVLWLSLETRKKFVSTVCLPYSVYTYTSGGRRSSEDTCRLSLVLHLFVKFNIFRATHTILRNSIFLCHLKDMLNFAYVYAYVLFHIHTCSQILVFQSEHGFCCCCWYFLRTSRDVNLLVKFLTSKLR